MAKRKMSNDARNARNAYYRAWRAKNPDKVRNSNKRYWERKAAELTKEGGGDNGRCTDGPGNGTTGKG